MKIASTVARYLLALIFLTFGSNLFLHFIPMGPPPTGTMGQFSAALGATPYLQVIGFFQVAPAILLLLNRYVPLALTLLGPVIVNILLIHLFMAPSGLPVAGLVIVLWALVFYSVHSAFAGIFAQRVAA
jgi:putative oxidoreductase